MDIFNAKSLVVSQDNRISQTLRVDRQSLSLTVYQKRLLLLLISHITKETEDFEVEEISFADYCRVMNIPKGGKTWELIRQNVLDLCKQCFLVDTTPTKTEVFSWIDSSETEILWDKQVIRTKLGKKLKQYYLGLHEKFTSFQLGFVLGFKSKYSYRLYEYLKSYVEQGIITVRIERAYEIFSDNRYHLVTDLERYVLAKAISEINEFSDIRVKHNKIKKGRKTTHVSFLIKVKPESELKEIRERWCEQLTALESINQQIADAFDEDEDSYVKQCDSAAGDDDYEEINVFED